MLIVFASYLFVRLSEVLLRSSMFSMCSSTERRAKVLEAEGDKRTAELVSEGEKIRMKNESEGTLIKVSNEAQARKVQLVLEVFFFFLHCDGAVLQKFNSLIDIGTFPSISIICSIFQRPSVSTSLTAVTDRGDKITIDEFLFLHFFVCFILPYFYSHLHQSQVFLADHLLFLLSPVPLHLDFFLTF